MSAILPLLAIATAIVLGRIIAGVILVLWSKHT